MAFSCFRPGEKINVRCIEGDAPGFIADTSDFPSGREVRTGHLAYQKIGKVADYGGDFKFWIMKNKFALFFCDVPSWVCLLHAEVRYVARFPVLRTWT
jgi:hypothetical protein